MSNKIQRIAEKRYHFKIISSRDESGKINLEFAWEVDQGLGTACHEAADALLKGKASDSGGWNDPVKEDTQTEYSEEEQRSPQTIQQRY